LLSPRAARHRGGYCFPLPRLAGHPERTRYVFRALERLALQSVAKHALESDAGTAVAAVSSCSHGVVCLSEQLLVGDGQGRKPTGERVVLERAGDDKPVHVRIERGHRHDNAEPTKVRRHDAWHARIVSGSEDFASPQHRLARGVVRGERHDDLGLTQPPRGSDGLANNRCV